MLRLRTPFADTLDLGKNRSVGEDLSTVPDALACAGTGVIRSAICAMKTPAPAMVAAANRMVRFTPLTRIQRSADITTTSSKPGLNREVKAALSAKRMSEALTNCIQVPRGLTRRVGRALAGSSGHGWRG